MKFYPNSLSRRSVLSTAIIVASLALSASAQTPQPAGPGQSAITTPAAPPSDRAALLPEAPIPFDLLASSSSDSPGDKAASAATNGLGSPTAEASHTQKYIEPGQSVPTLAAGDKVALGLRDAFSLFSVSAWFASAGWEQLINGSPNYGTDRGAFGQRLGASAIRDVTEGVFSDSVMSPILHEDPRYYRMGPGHPILLRAAYAATRAIITRTNGGHMSPNLALIGGNAAGAALTDAYYPPLNRGFTQTAETFGGSIGGSALGFVVSEFYDDVFHPHRNR